jgi:hypothetical protein
MLKNQGVILSKGMQNSLSVQSDNNDLSKAGEGHNFECNVHLLLATHSMVRLLLGKELPKSPLETILPQFSAMCYLVEVPHRAKLQRQILSGRS